MARGGLVVTLLLAVAQGTSAWFALGRGRSSLSRPNRDPVVRDLLDEIALGGSTNALLLRAADGFLDFCRSQDNVHDAHGLWLNLAAVVFLMYCDSFIYPWVYFAHTWLAAAWAGLSVAHTPLRVRPVMQAKLEEVKAWYARRRASRAVKLLEKDQSKLAHLKKTAATLKVKAKIDARLNKALSQRARARIEYDEAKAWTVKARNGQRCEAHCSLTELFTRVGDAILQWRSKDRHACGAGQQALASA
jgi:ribosomal protein L31E